MNAEEPDRVRPQPDVGREEQMIILAEVRRSSPVNRQAPQGTIDGRQLLAAEQDVRGAENYPQDEAVRGSASDSGSPSHVCKEGDSGILSKFERSARTRQDIQIAG
jgi:hypothetical protein